MLLRLGILGFGLLSETHLQFSPGFNVLSGETGAGKSMVLSALGLLAGGPVPRQTAPAQIEAELDLSQVSRERLSELGLCAGTICVGRSLLGRGKSRATLDGVVVPVARLRAIVGQVLSLTAQHAVREIASRAGVLEVLDARGELGELARSLREQLLVLAQIERQLNHVVSMIGTRGQHPAEVRLLIQEIEALEPRPGEHAELMQRCELRDRSEQYLQIAQSVSLALNERETPIEAELVGLLQQIRRAPPSAVLQRLAIELGNALLSLDAAGREASRLADQASLEPQDQAKLERRLESFVRLSKRLGVAPDALAVHVNLLRERLAEIETLEQQLTELTRSQVTAREHAESLATELYRRRSAAIPRVREDLERELAALTLPGAQISLELQPFESNRLGMSQLSLGFCANPGEPLLPLERVASGGERSRLALALCCIGSAQGRTLVFDEIDQGVGGEAALAVAERLQRLGRRQQVLCVTHQAAIAARADAHFRVCKSTTGGSTVASVDWLNDEQRTLELSRMLAGGRAVDASRTLARRLLEAGRRAA